MSRSAPFWTALGQGPEFWSVKGPDTGIVQLLDANGASAGAVAFRACPDIHERLVAALRPFAGAASPPKVKIVADSRLIAAARAAAGELGFGVEKAVEREGAYEIRFAFGEGKMQVSMLEKRASVNPARTRVLIIDDSPLICSILSNVLSGDKDLEVVGTVGLPSEVEAAIDRLKPDVATLDIHLPEMNGVEVLKRFLQPRGIPSIIISSISPEEGPLVLSALEAGAVDYIQKPSSQEVLQMTPVILAKVKTAAKIIPRGTLPSSAEKARVNPREVDLSRLIAFGSSTGGTKALSEIFIRLPKEIPPIVVAQHIPAGFSKAFADRLNSLCPFEVTEAKQGDMLRPGRVLIAPGGRQMRVVRAANGSLVVNIEDSSSPQVHKPSVDLLFQSVRETCGSEAVAVLLTGMGADGAKGMLALRQNGCATIAQDEASCIVFGMPQAAMQLEAAAKMVPLLDIAQELMDEVSGKNGKRKAG